MKPHRFHAVFLLCMMCLCSFVILGHAGGNKVEASTTRAIEVASPDGLVSVMFSLADRSEKQNVPVYEVSYKETRVIAPSPLGLCFDGADDFDGGFTIKKVTRTSHNSSYTPVYAERKTIPDSYCGATIQLQETASPGRTLVLIFRVYNEGAAFCYSIPKQKALDEFVIAQEASHFCLTDDHTSYAVYSAQGIYKKVPVSKIGNNCERPLTIEMNEGPVISIGEAKLIDYARMRLSRNPQLQHTLVSSLANDVKGKTPFTTPWRVVLVADTAAELLERNYLFMNLNDPCAIEDPSWIKPGKVIREVTLTTKGGRACVDFAAAHNLQYVEFDAGWYGHEYTEDSDATTISVDPKRSPGPLELHEVIDYAEKRGIGILVYVNRRALERQLDTILPLYQKWGIKGVKYGFVRVGSQKWTSWLHEAVRKAAKYKLMVDVHDEYRPTGYSRTYPNLMTQEGIRGNECMPTAAENLILPFTRQLCGAGDYTVCYYSNRIKTTHAHQLACSVVFFSPWQFLFWYDRPSAYKGEPEIEFFEHLPTVWDATEVINARIGSFITIARKRGNEWFIGSMTDTQKRSLTIPLTFLDKGKKYTAHIYSDGGEAVKTRTHVKVQKRAVTRKTVLNAAMPPNGGHAVWIHPKR